MGGMGQFMSRMVTPGSWDAVDILIWVIVAALVVTMTVVAFALLGAKRPGASRGKRSSVQILEDRFAKGEVSEEEFERRRDALERI